MIRRGTGYLYFFLNVDSVPLDKQKHNKNEKDWKNAIIFTFRWRSFEGRQWGELPPSGRTYHRPENEAARVVWRGRETGTARTEPNRLLVVERNPLKKGDIK